MLVSTFSLSYRYLDLPFVSIMPFFVESKANTNKRPHGNPPSFTTTEIKMKITLPIDSITTFYYN